MQKRKLTNRAGNLTYSTDRLSEAVSAEQICSLLLKTGQGESPGQPRLFNFIADQPTPERWSPNRQLQLKHDLSSLQLSVRLVIRLVSCVCAEIPRSTSLCRRERDVLRYVQNDAYLPGVF
jgi:hypothetical protein